jgi:hypothetical protein
MAGKQCALQLDTSQVHAECVAGLKTLNDGFEDVEWQSQLRPNDKLEEYCAHPGATQQMLGGQYGMEKESGSV